MHVLLFVAQINVTSHVLPLYSYTFPYILFYLEKKSFTASYEMKNHRRKYPSSVCFSFYCVRSLTTSFFSNFLRDFSSTLPTLLCFLSCFQKYLNRHEHRKGGRKPRRDVFSRVLFFFSFIPTFSLFAVIVELFSLRRYYLCFFFLLLLRRELNNLRTKAIRAVMRSTVGFVVFIVACY